MTKKNKRIWREVTFWIYLSLFLLCFCNNANSTTVIAVKVSEGIVLAGDSRTTLAVSKTLAGITKITNRIATDYTDKVFQINENVGALTYGESHLLEKNIHSLVEEFKVADAAINKKTIDEVSKLLRDHFDKLYKEHLSKYPNTIGMLGFMVAGYDSSGKSKLLRFEFPAGEIIPIKPDELGAAWSGQTEDIQRLIKGCDAVVAFKILGLMKFGLSDFSVAEFSEQYTIKKLCDDLRNDHIDVKSDTVQGLNNVLTLTDLYEQVMKRKNQSASSEVLRQFKEAYDRSRKEDDLKKLNRKILEVFYPQGTPKVEKKINPYESEYNVGFQYMTIRDAIDFSDFLIRTTIEMQRFSYGSISGGYLTYPGVGGAIDIAIITPTGFKWIRKKSIKIQE